MFDLDLSKLVMFAVVALVVIGPKELPAALRVAGRAMKAWRDLRGRAMREIRELTELADDKSLGGLASLEIARNPRTAMRAGAAEPLAAEASFVSEEMRAYLGEAAEPAVETAAP